MSGAASPGRALDAAASAPVRDQLEQAHAQIAVLVRMLEEGRPCEDVVARLTTVSAALDRAGFALVSAGLEQCLLAAQGQDSVDVTTLRRLLLAFA